MPHAYQALLLLGGNTGDPTATLGLAEAMIAREAGGVLARSRDHWTEPWGFEDSRLFLNRALLMETTLPPETLMRTLLRIERELGRERGSERYAARSIDIDILLLNGQVIGTEALTVPHPRMHERAFALEPAADIAPQWVHPLLHRTVLELLNDLRDPA